MTSPKIGEACESKALTSRIDQTEPLSQLSRGSGRLGWRRGGYDITKGSRSDPAVLPQQQAFQLLT